MAASQQRKLRRLLEQKGYEADEPDIMGATRYSLVGARDVLFYPNMGDFPLKAAFRQIETDTRHRDPEHTNETARAQTAWEAQEQERLEREAADAARVKNTRLGGLSAVLTEKEVDAVARRTEKNIAHHRQLERMMRQKPLAS